MVLILNISNHRKTLTKKKIILLENKLSEILNFAWCQKGEERTRELVSFIACWLPNILSLNAEVASTILKTYSLGLQIYPKFNGPYGGTGTCPG